MEPKVISDLTHLVIGHSPSLSLHYHTILPMLHIWLLAFGKSRHICHSLLPDTSIFQKYIGHVSRAFTLQHSNIQPSWNKHTITMTNQYPSKLKSLIQTSTQHTGRRQWPKKFLCVSLLSYTPNAMLTTQTSIAQTDHRELRQMSLKTCWCVCVNDCHSRTYYIDLHQHLRNSINYLGCVRYRKKKTHIVIVWQQLRALRDPTTHHCNTWHTLPQQVAIASWDEHPYLSV